MSALIAPGPPIVGDPELPRPVRAAHHTLIGFVATRRVVEVILTLVLGVGSGLLFYGSTFGLDMVHTQLGAQSISFPDKSTAALDPVKFPDLQRYAGQKVDSGPKAKAYANGFINRHLAAVADGQTYSQMSAASQADPTNAKLTAQVATLFKGETLRGLLLYAWGWSVVSTIAVYAATGALIGFVVMALITVGDFVADPRIAARHIAQA